MFNQHSPGFLEASHRLGQSKAMLDALAKGAEVNVCTDGRHESPLMLAAGARSSRGLEGLNGTFGWFLGRKMWMFPKIGGKTTPNHPLRNRGFPLFSPSILGYHCFWKHPCVFFFLKHSIPPKSPKVKEFAPLKNDGQGRRSAFPKLGFGNFSGTNC